MKRKNSLLKILCCGLIILSLTTGCGSNNVDTNNGDNSSSNNSNDTSNNTNISFTQTNTILGYTIKYPTNSSVSNSKYGKAFSYGTNISVITEGPASVGSIFTVSDLEDAVDKCKEYIYSSLESRNTNLFSSNSTTQIVESSKHVKVNGINMLKVMGTFNNIRDNTNIEYVAYYMIASSSDGSDYPIYIVGISLTEINDSLENFMDTMVSEIEK